MEVFPAVRLHCVEQVITPAYQMADQMDCLPLVKQEGEEDVTYTAMLDEQPIKYQWS